MGPSQSDCAQTAGTLIPLRSADRESRAFYVRPKISRASVSVEAARNSVVELRAYDHARAVRVTANLPLLFPSKAVRPLRFRREERAFASSARPVSLDLHGGEINISMASVSDVLVVDLLPRFRSSPAIPRPLDMSGFRVSERLPDADFEGRENDWATDDFLIGTPSIEFSRALQIDSEGPRLVGFESDSESDGQQIDLEDCEELDLEGSGDLGLPCRWECLQLGENRREQNEDFEWEEVDGRIDERDALGVTIIGEEERSEEVRDLVRDGPGDQGDGARWEVLLSAYSFGRNEIDSVDVEAYYVDEQDEFVYTSDNEEAYEVLFEHLADHDSDVKCSPASKTVIESLPSVIFTEEDLANDNAVCAVCKDGILVNEIVKRLPCSHLYHKECILPWLEIRNTCPLCRFELPTDSEHEKLKDRRYEELQLRFDFEVLPDA
ncbi:hypothetical protein ZIOFF_019668 [Zingiber officinale]|uniref:RING-type E3 ubiquitin transferase n=1 Tax=Zingiber officinale TaxID=94328 RepID=A0A8J5HM85_ZINOF|nr:hypothetical protein ZIOFF_019668 [Zingiber officinale]